MNSSRVAKAVVSAALFLLIAALAVTLTGCVGVARQQNGAAPSLKPPSPWSLATPESAVRSYLDWTSYAYRIGDSDVASATMSPDELVRVDSYLELNHERGRRINQRVTSLAFGKQSIEGTRTLVPTTESWIYDYISATDGKPLSQDYTASYDATYTLVRSSSTAWIVDSVFATKLGPVK